jgi:hypothetical protein
MESVRFSETSVNFYQNTQRHIAEDSKPTLRSVKCLDSCLVFMALRVRFSALRADNLGFFVVLSVPPDKHSNNILKSVMIVIIPHSSIFSRSTLYNLCSCEIVGKFANKHM